MVKFVIIFRALDPCRETLHPFQSDAFAAPHHLQPTACVALWYAPIPALFDACVLTTRRKHIAERELPKQGISTSPPGRVHRSRVIICNGIKWRKVRLTK
jgi:hypothetical protein